MSGDGARGEDVGRSRVLENFTLGSGAGVGRGTLGGGAVFSNTLGGGAGATVNNGRPGDEMTVGTGQRCRRVNGGGPALARCCLLLKRVAQVDSRVVIGEFCVGVGVVGAITGATVVVEVATLKIAASCLIAAICSVLKDGHSDAGDGLSSAAVNSRAASVAVSADDVASIVVACEKKSKREILPARVLGM